MLNMVLNLMVTHGHGHSLGEEKDGLFWEKERTKH